MTTGSVLAERRAFSLARLQTVSEAVATFDELNIVSDLSIYATGSYGRLEAASSSDIDLFFIHETNDPTALFPRRVKMLVDADLIRLLKREGFPPFSGDGEYLEIHNLSQIEASLGSREDDYRNFFTARLLLLLESRPVFGTASYERVLNRLIQAYFDDYHDHEDEFRPLFLVNDIIRFWKTLCLNYEHRRDRRRDEVARNKSHLLNLKLKFSRMLTCYSMISVLAAEPKGIAPARITEIVSEAPTDRVTALARRLGAEDIAARLWSDYEWFLEATGRPKEEALEWISVKQTRDEAFDRARRFGGSMFELLAKACEGTEQMRYLVI